MHGPTPSARPGLTDIYNVLERVRAGESLTTKDKALHDAALISTLWQLHDDLDRAVADAEILEYVFALNSARAAEETKGQVRWLRPDYQKPLFSRAKPEDVQEILETQCALGRAHHGDTAGTYVR